MERNKILRFLAMTVTSRMLDAHKYDPMCQNASLFLMVHRANRKVGFEENSGQKSGRSVVKSDTFVASDL